MYNEEKVLKYIRNNFDKYAENSTLSCSSISNDSNSSTDSDRSQSNYIDLIEFYHQENEDDEISLNNLKINTNDHFYYSDWNFDSKLQKSQFCEDFSILEKNK